MGESILPLQLPHILAVQGGHLEDTSRAAAFLDFAKACDTVNRTFLLQAMEGGGSRSQGTKPQGLLSIIISSSTTTTITTSGSNNPRGLTASNTANTTLSSRG